MTPEEVKKLREEFLDKSQVIKNSDLPTGEKQIQLLALLTEYHAKEVSHLKPDKNIKKLLTQKGRRKTYAKRR